MAYPRRSWRRHAATALAALAVATLVLAGRADAFIYWASDDGAIHTSNLDGSTANPDFIDVFGSNGGFPVGVAVDGAHIYWTNSNGAIGRANLNGTGVVQNFIAVAADPEGVAVDSNYIYWTNVSGTIGRANVNGTGTPNQSFITGASAPQGIAVDSAHIYWTNRTTGTIGRANLNGGSPQQDWVTTGAFPTGLAVNSTHLYFANFNSSSIGVVTLSSGATDPSLIGDINRPTGLAVDSSFLYWGSNILRDSFIGRANLNGSGAQLQFAGADTPEGLAVDALQGTPPPPTIAQLVPSVEGLGLPHGIERSLLAKLESAQQRLDGGRVAGACGKLGSFANEVRAQTGKKIDAGAAAGLIADVGAVRDSAGCGSN